MMTYTDQYKFKNNRYDYFLFYILFFFSVLNFTITRQPLYFLWYTIALILYLKKDTLLKKDLLKVIILYVVIMVFQLIEFQRGTPQSIGGEFMYLTYAYMLVTIFREKIPFYYVNIIVFLSVISFVFYFPSLLSSTIYNQIWGFGKLLNLDIDHPWKTSFFIYTVEPYSPGAFFLRNSANFKEPGYYAAYLSLALAINLITKMNLFHWKNLILIIAMLTTFSTAGYITMFIVISFYFYYSKRINNSLRFLLIFAVISLSMFAYLRLEFLNEKVNDHIQKQGSGYEIKGRFGATLVNLEEITEHYWIGRGLVPQTRFDKTDFLRAEVHRVGTEKAWQDLNSWTGMMVRLGLPGFILFMFWYIKSVFAFTRGISIYKSAGILIMFSVFIPLSSQPMLTTPIFYSILFWGKLFPRENKSAWTKNLRPAIP